MIIPLMQDIDQQILFLLNGSDSLFLDAFITTLTATITWVPLYAAILYLVIKNHETMPQIVLTIAAAVITVALTAAITNLIVKPYVARLRPCNDPFIKSLVDIVIRLPRNDYSFFSAHAANTFSLAVFLSLLIRGRVFTSAIFIWALVNCYTRLYLGVHYPSDILCGILFGSFVGFCMYVLYLKFYLKIAPQQNFVSSHYTSTGYSVADVNIVINVLILTLIYALIRASVLSFAINT